MDMILEQFKTIFDRPEKVKKLRETIFDLAVRGKLVEQDPNDEPASVLLERIKEEKERLVKEKKIKKEKPLAEISEEEKPFELPNGWEFVRIGGLGNIFNGNSINSKIKETVYANIEDGYNYISTKDVAFDGGKIEYNTGVKIPYDDKKFKVAHNGSVLICSEGGSAGRKIGLTDRDICFGNKLYAIEPFSGVLSEYIFYIYQSRMFYNSFASKMTGIIGGISTANFKEIIIPLCSMNEQLRIVEKVHSLIVFCDKLEKALEKKVHYGELVAKSVFNTVGNVSTAEELEETLRFILLNFKDLSLGDSAVKELKNCILQLAVQGKLVPQDPNDEPAEVLLEKIREEKERLIKEKKIKKEKPLAEISEEEKPFELPCGWEWVRLLDANIDIGDVDHRMPKEVERGIPYISPRDFYGKNEISFDSAKKISMDDYMILSKKSKPEVSDIIFPRYGTIGVIRFVEEEKPFLVSYSCATIKTYKNNVTPNYIRYYLESNIVKDEIIKYVNKTTQPNVGVKSIKNFICPIPPLEEQKRIVEKVDSLMKLCDQLEKKIQKQKDYSNRLMESILKSSF